MTRELYDKVVVFLFGAFICSSMAGLVIIIAILDTWLALGLIRYVLAQ